MASDTFDINLVVFKNSKIYSNCFPPLFVVVVVVVVAVVVVVVAAI